MVRRCILDSILQKEWFFFIYQEGECGLSLDQIKEAVKAIEKGEAETNEAKSKMAKANLRLVISIKSRGRSCRACLTGTHW